MHQKLRLCLVLAGFLLVNAGWSQKSLLKAERQFELKAFDLAIENAKKALDKNEECAQCYYIIAESFRMMNENVDAANWYRKLEKFDDLPKEFTYNYGLLLKRMGEYEKARTYFNKYKLTDPIVGELFANSCDFAIRELSSDNEFELNLYGPSSKSTDYGPTIYQDKLIWSSFRNDFKRDLEIQNTSTIQAERTQLFKGNMGFTGDIENTEFLLSNEMETYDMGPVHYASEAPFCAVTKNNFRDGEKQIFTNDLELSLFIANVNEDGSFSSLKAFPFNEVGYATGFGTLNPTGKILYFASNRPGGYGGFDLYVSYFKNGQWTYPDNLGPQVNTQGNEITPYFDGETLYFSSDFRMGIGGYDVFSTFVNYGKWEVPENMGKGVNSPEDDYYFIKHPFMDSYYLTSNRLGGRGYHDIYLVHMAPKQEMVADMTPPAVDIEEDIIADDIISTSLVGLEEEVVDATNIPPAVPVDSYNENADFVESVSTEFYGEEELAADEFETTVKEIDIDALAIPKSFDIARHTTAKVSLAGAKRVSIGDIIDNTSNVYFIQLAALFKSKADMSIFNGLDKFGALYKVQHSNSTKVKLGYFVDEEHAKQVLAKVKNMGYGDAFLTFEVLNPSRMELVKMSEDTKISNANQGYVTDHTTGVQYKVRLASYSDPVWFNTESVNDLGIIEQWSKADWTIFILSGYPSKDDAERARLAAVGRGYADAELVVDRHGILEKVK